MKEILDQADAMYRIMQVVCFFLMWLAFFCVSSCFRAIIDVCTDVSDSFLYGCGMCEPENTIGDCIDNLCNCICCCIALPFGVCTFFCWCSAAWVAYNPKFLIYFIPLFILVCCGVACCIAVLVGACLYAPVGLVGIKQRLAAPPGDEGKIRVVRAGEGMDYGKM